MQRIPAVEEFANDLTRSLERPVEVAGRHAVERRVSRYRYARFAWSLPSWTVLPTDADALRQAWLEQGGALSAFLYRDPDINSFDNDIGTGDGVKTDFVLEAAMGAYRHPVFHPDLATLAITIDDQPAAYTFVVDNNTPLIRFGQPPGTGVKVHAAGEFDFAVRFDDGFAEQLAVPGGAVAWQGAVLREVFE